MATTTNYGWTTPDDTALVKDGASAIRTLGTSVDTSVKSLNPGTTAGDVDYYTSATAKARLAIGTTGQVLTVAGGVPSWSTIAAGAYTSLATGSLSGSTTSITGFSSAYRDLYIRVVSPKVTTTIVNPRMEFNNDSGAKYIYCNAYAGDATTRANNGTGTTPVNYAQGTLGNTVANSDTWFIYIPEYSATDNVKIWQAKQATYAAGAGNTYNLVQDGMYMSASAITTVRLFLGSQTFNGGSYTVFGVK
jgi:hypothetical protein